MSEMVLRIWGRKIKLANFTGEDLAEVFDTFGGSIRVTTDGREPELTVHRQHGNAAGCTHQLRRNRPRLRCIERFCSIAGSRLKPLQRRWNSVGSGAPMPMPGNSRPIWMRRRRDRATLRA